MDIEHTSDNRILKNPYKRIVRLSNELANQIAAGEVIERPASVLKELLENSLDAGSTHISITIERGGIGLIRVQDNGVGICKEDLELSLSQHATSKVKILDDLEGIQSFGFRGEALASISAVSRLSLSSCVEEQEMGYRIQREGRKDAFTLTPVGRFLGTTIEVRDLFFNTPARRKFLKSERTETLAIEELFKRIALSHPQVAFQYQEGERQKNLPQARSFDAEMRRIGTLCGQNFIKAAQHIESESNGLTLRGWLGSPEQLRAKADLQYFYVNGRMVRDKIVNHAIRQAYQDMGADERHPAFLLFLELDPHRVDVNVHPTKHEVRFRESRTIHAFLGYSVRESFQTVTAQDESILVADTIRPHPITALEPTTEKSQRVYQSLGTYQTYQGRSFNNSHSDPITRMQSLDVKPNPVKTEEDDSTEVLRALPILKLRNELLFIEEQTTVTVVDLKGFQAALVTSQLQQIAHPIPSRSLFMPVRLEIEHNQSLASTVDLHKMGFQWNSIGEHTLLLRTVPEVMKEVTEGFADCFHKMLLAPQWEKAVECLAHYIADQGIEHSILTPLNYATLSQSLTEIQHFNAKLYEKIARIFTYQQLKSILL